MQNMNKENDFDKVKSLAEDLVKQEKYDEAIVQYEKALKLNENDAECHSRLGMINLTRNEFKDAETQFQISLQNDPDQTEAYFNLGYLYQEQNEFEKALSFYKIVIERQPDNSMTFFRMGTCALFLNRKNDAKAFFHEALRHQPDSLDSAVQLASLCIEDNDYQDAEDVLRLCLVSHPEEESIIYTLALVLKEQEKYESALAQFNKLIAINGKHAEGFFHLADCCVQLGLIKQAEPFYAQAYKLEPTFAEPVLKLGELYESKKNMDKAVVMYRQWISMNDVTTVQQNHELTDLFQAKCQLVAEYFKQKGDSEEDAANYANLANAIKSDDAGLKAKDASVLEPEEYRVSLQIDD